MSQQRPHGRYHHFVLLCLVIGCLVLSVFVSCLVFVVCLMFFCMFLCPLPYIPRFALPERADHQAHHELVVGLLKQRGALGGHGRDDEKDDDGPREGGHGHPPSVHG
jgi:hypothetical protein